MKRIILLTLACLFTEGVFAQKYAFLNTETIFRAIPEYNTTLEELEKFAQAYRDQIDAQYDKIAEMYDRYQFQKNNLSESARKQVEDNIIGLEQELEQTQEKYFGPRGEVMTKRIETIKPIQDRVFTAIDNIAQQNGYDMVIDIANNSSIIYYNQSLDISNEVLKSLGIR
ncbi:MAG: OmpH family outer membrane protein [Rikenellaceae bacterium]|nr:OmpH family outer membrane protein [Rikenellaceae bacterium]